MFIFDIYLYPLSCLKICHRIKSFHSLKALVINALYIVYSTCVLIIAIFSGPPPPPTTPPPCVEGWTEFFNVDHPENNTVGDDNEDIEHIRKFHHFCSDDMIGHVECKALLDGKPVDYKAVGQAKGVRCSPHLGFHCFNDQVKEPCYDYMVRFFCYCPTPAPPPVKTTYTGPPTLPPTGTPITTPEPCRPRWTEFFNVDNPKINPNGDDNENITALRRTFDICEDDMISEADCRTEIDGELVDYRRGGQVKAVECSPHRGFHCFKNMLSEPCRDYQIRFYCNCPTPPPPPTTPGTGPTEPGTPKPICQDGWTEFFNTNKPEDNVDGDDEEITEELREIYPFCSNDMISEVDCRTEVNGELVDYRSTSQANAVVCSKHHGVHCYRGELDEDCRDYSIRFYCVCPTPSPITPPPPTTTPSPFTLLSTPACEDGYEFDLCAYNCDQTCNHFLHNLIESGRCEKNGGSQCIPGCRPKGGCERPRLWRDHHTCVDENECTCGYVSEDGIVVIPPTGTETFGCEKCQCIDNKLECSSIAGCNYTTATAPPLKKSTIVGEDCWTAWMNDDTPDTAGGDFENIVALHNKYLFCVDPQEIQCRRVSDQKPASETGQKVTCDMETGLTCWNKQNSPTCDDYEIKVRCPCDWTTPPPTTTTLPTVVTGACTDGWTDWFNSHKPNEEGEYETVLDIRLDDNYFCGNNMIKGIECRKVGSTSTEIHQHKVVCSIGAGLLCKNSDQPGGEYCDDYEVRFYCDCLAKPPPTTTETVFPTRELTTPGIGGCNSWSRWVNDRHPSKVYDVSLDESEKPYDDDEHKDLPTLKDEQQFCLVGQLTSIECRDSDTDVDYTETTDRNITCSLHEGLKCDATQQRTVGCRDYKVRYFCNCEEEPTVIVLPSITTLTVPECAEHYDVVERLPDYLVRSSSNLKPTMSTKQAKLSTTNGPDSEGAWVAGTIDDKQYLEFDLGKVQPVYGVATKGRQDTDEYVKTYRVLYSRDGIAYSYVSEPDDYDKLKTFTANSDGNSLVKHMFISPFEARYVRIQPISYNKEIAMRAGVYLCQEGTTLPPTTTPRPEPVCEGYMVTPTLPLTDEQITFSSVQEPHSKPKIDSKTGWTPSIQDKNQFVQVDLEYPTEIVGFDTKGHGKLPQYVRKFTVSFSHDGTVWTDIKEFDGTKKVFPANSDTTTSVRTLFPKPIRVRFVRLHPTDWENGISLRFDVLGCPPKVTTTPRTPPPTSTTTPAPTTPKELCIVYGQWLNLVESPLKDIVIPLEKITANSKLCGNPVDIQCREIISGRDHSDMDQDTTCDLENGFICRQGTKHCSIYEVRIGCDNSSACVTTAPTLPPITMCEELPRDRMPKCENLDCPTNFSCDGNACVPDVDCPCFKDGKSFKPGDRIITSDCKACDCIKGHSRCEDILCTPCPMGAIQKMQPNCECSCMTCETPKILCAFDGTCMEPEKYCDGVVDCGDGSDEMNCPTSPVSTLTPPPPTTPPTCSLDYRNRNYCEYHSDYFWTFDGFEYQYEICNNKLVNDMNGKFEISLHKECKPGSGGNCNPYVITKIGKREVKLGPDGQQVAIDGNEYTIENLYLISKKYEGEFVVKKHGRGLLLEAPKEGFRVKWTPPGIVRVTVSNCLRGRLNGLCGLYNNIPQDDMQKPDGRPSSNSIDFGDSWKTSKEECFKPVCEIDRYTKAAKACDEMKKEPFDVCHEDANIASHIAVCTTFMCDCLERHNDTSKGYKECKCEALQNYVEACVRNNPSLREPVEVWRTKYGCIPECPDGQIWDECGPDCLLTCDNYNKKQSLCDAKACVPGCTCPHGQVLKNGRCVKPKECLDCECLAIGDPNYVTYDNKRYDFQGNCTYVLSKYDGDDGSTTFTITEDNVPCRDDPLSTCANGVTVEVVGHKIKLNVQGVFIDGNHLGPEVSFYEDEDYDITIQNDKIYVLHVRENNLVVTYNRDIPSVKVQIPSYIYAGKTRGLCGDCNTDPSNDFVQPDETPTSDVYDFGNSWFIPGAYVDEDGNPKLCVNATQPPTVPPVPECKFPESTCDMVVDKTLYEGVCKHDAGYSKEPEKAVCKSKLQYAQECCEKDITLKSWIDQNGCLPKCGANQTLQCVPGCMKTCDNYKDFDPKDCDHPKLLTCTCNPGLVLKDDKCVEPKACEICDKEGHGVGDKWKPSPCEECECKPDLKITCQKSVCPSPPMCKDDEQIRSQEPGKEECCPKYFCEPRTECEQKPLPECEGNGKILSRSTGEDNCPVYKCTCQEATCPDPVKPSDLEPGEELQLVKKDCCPEYERVCNEDKCPERRKCFSNEQLEVIEGKCCDIFTCSRITDCSEILDEPNEEGEYFNKYKVGQVWFPNKCKRCTCEGDPRETGLPRMVCTDTVCPKTMDQRKSNIVYKPVDIPGQCCPEYVPVMCTDGVRNYTVGEEWRLENDACQIVKCVREEDDQINVEYRSERCERCPKNTEAQETLPGECCPKCELIGCLGEDDRVMKFGQILPSTLEACQDVRCVRAIDDKGYKLQYQNKSCIPVSEDCPLELRKMSECCMICTAEPPTPATTRTIEPCLIQPLPLDATTMLFYFKHPEHGYCTNRKPVPKMRKCAGSCPQESDLTYTEGKGFEHNCDCCKPAETTPIPVTVKCKDGKELELTYENPTKCQCTACKAKDTCEVPGQ